MKVRPSGKRRSSSHNCTHCTNMSNYGNTCVHKSTSVSMNKEERPWARATIICTAAATIARGFV